MGNISKISRGEELIMRLKNVAKKINKLTFFDNDRLQRETKKLLRMEEKRRKLFFANERYFVV